MLAIIGGSGLYSLQQLKIEKEHVLDTPFGQPSDKIMEGVLEGEKFYFFPDMEKDISFYHMR